MSPAWMALLALGSPASELPRSEREVMALVVRAPGLTGERRAETFEALRSALEGLTPFRIEDASEGVRESENPLDAIVSAVAGQYRRVPELVLALSILSTPGSSNAQVSWQLIRAREAVEQSERSHFEGTGTSDLSNLVEAFALLDTDLAAPTSSLVERLVEGLRPALEARSWWRPHGRLHVELPEAGFVLRLGSQAFPSESTKIEIEDVQAGLRELHLEHADYEPMQSTLQVEVGAVNTWRPIPVPRALAGARVPRKTVLITGLGLLAAGGAFLAVAAAQASQPGERCLSLPGEAACGSVERDFARLGPVPTAPLGYSLALTGSVLAGGVFLTEETTYPWWWTALGVGLGAAAFTVSTLAD